MNNEKVENDSKPQRGKAGKLVVPPEKLPKPDTRDLPASVKLKELGIKDVTDQYIGKSFIITGGGVPTTTATQKPEDKKPKADGKSDIDKKPKSPSEMGKSLAETVGWPLKRDTRKLPGRMKIQGFSNIVDVTDRHIGKSFIIMGGGLPKTETPDISEKEGDRE